MKYLCIVVTLLVAACARQASPDVYDSERVGEADTTYAGKIVEAKEVRIQGGESLSDNALGGVGGGVAGAMIGSTIGHGAGTVLAEIGGAIVGAAGGASLEQSLKSGHGMQYIVELDNGELKTVVQSIEPRFEKGDKVWVIVSHRGRSRVISR